MKLLNFLTKDIFIILVFILMFAYLLDRLYLTDVIPILLTSLGAHFILKAFFFSKGIWVSSFYLVVGFNFMMVVFVKFVFI